MKAIAWPWIITGLTLAGLALARSAEAAPPPAPPPAPPGPTPPGPLPPAPEPGCNAPPELIAQAGVLAAQAANPLTRNTLDPDVMVTLSDRLDQHGCENEATALRAAANLVRLSRGNRPFQPAPGGGMHAAPGVAVGNTTIPPDLAEKARTLLDPTYQPTSKTSALHAIDALIAQLRKIGTTEATHIIAELQERKTAFKFPG